MTDIVYLYQNTGIVPPTNVRDAAVSAYQNIGIAIPQSVLNVAYQYQNTELPPIVVGYCPI